MYAIVSVHIKNVNVNRDDREDAPTLNSIHQYPRIVATPEHTIVYSYP